MATDEKKNNLRTLTVKKTVDGYIEQDANGHKKQYVRVSMPYKLGIENLQVHCSVDAQSGEKRMVIVGNTTDEFRAIGATEGSSIFGATISAGDQPGKATILNSYMLEGRYLNNITLTINVAATAIAAMIDELRLTKVERVIYATAKIGTFFAEDPGDLRSPLLLPWLEDQRKTITSDSRNYEFNLEIDELTITPKNDWPSEFKPLHHLDVSLTQQPLIIRYDTSENPFKPTITKGELATLFSLMLWLVGAVVIGTGFFILRFW